MIVNIIYLNNEIQLCEATKKKNGKIANEIKRTRKFLFQSSTRKYEKKNIIIVSLCVRAVFFSLCSC